MIANALRHVASHNFYSAGQWIFLRAKNELGGVAPGPPVAT